MRLMAVGSLSPSLFRYSFLLTLSKTLPFRPLHDFRHAAKLLSSPFFLPLKATNAKKLAKTLHHRSMNSHSSPSPAPKLPPAANPNPNPYPAKKRGRRESPEGQLRFQLDMCSKRGDLTEALRLYDDARLQSIRLSQHHYNVLLYLCSSAIGGTETGGRQTLEQGLERGFEIFRQMDLDSVPPNEATFTSVARLAAAKEDPNLAFEIIKKMSYSGIPPRLRSYGPALFGFCKKGDLEKAYEVEADMTASGVSPEEPELAALLELSAGAGRGDQVYRLLHRIRATVRQVSESTTEVLERWFGSDTAVEVGAEEWDVEKVREGVAKGGGGWHGQGWLGKGKWSVCRTEMEGNGVCRRCGERLVCIDIDPSETENFASSLANLACQREVKADFTGFQEWLDRHGPFDAVIDGANVSLYNQQNFSFFQLNSVVNAIQRTRMNPSNKMPLIVLHSRRVKGGPADNPHNKKLLESWRKSGALYATPPGSNDDWYWLYAAVRFRSLLVTNDEMRDHLFQLLGNSFFPRWKEKHQVRLTFSRRGPALHMPPPYSIVIQESDGGSWHIPTVAGDDIETPRQWVCATRNSVTIQSHSLLLHAS